MDMKELEAIAARQIEIEADRAASIERVMPLFVSEEYFSSAGVKPALTLCVATLSNGFTVIGKAFGEGLQAEARQDALDAAARAETVMSRAKVTTPNPGRAAATAAVVLAAHAQGLIKQGEL